MMFQLWKQLHCSFPGLKTERLEKSKPYHLSEITEFYEMYLIWKIKIMEVSNKCINNLKLHVFIISGVRAIAPEENCPPDYCPPDNCPPGKLPRGQLPPRKIGPRITAPRTTAPWMIAPRIIPSWTITPEDNCPRGKLPSGWLPPGQLQPGWLPPGQLPPGWLPPDYSPPDNCSRGILSTGHLHKCPPYNWSRK